MKRYNCFSKSSLLHLMLSIVIGVFCIMYVGEVVKYRTLFIPIGYIIPKLLRDYIVLVLFSWIFVFMIKKKYGYEISEDGIGAIVNTGKEWRYHAFVKWEDIVAINYKKSILLNYKGLEIHSSQYTHRNKKILWIGDDQRDFKEIVSIVCQKTNLTLD